MSAVSTAEKPYVRPKVRARAGAAQPMVLPRPLARHTEHHLALREQEPISIFAVVGFFLAALMVCVLIVGHVQLDQINEEQVAARAQLTQLQTEYQSLTAQYEQYFDLQEIETQLTGDGSMAAPTAQQQFYLDMTAPDSAVTFETGRLHALSQLSNLFSTVVEYFR